MRRREFIAGLGSAAASSSRWPRAARAQQAGSVRRIGVIIGVGDGPEGRARFATLKKGLEALGWVEGRNVRFDVRYTAGATNDVRPLAAEVVALSHDLIVANTNPVVLALKQETRAIPIVFVQVADPVNSGLVESLAQPGSNLTGFAGFEFSIAAKWVEVVKEIAPNVRRLAILRDSSSAASMAQAGAAQAAAASLGLESTPIDLRDRETIERGISAFARAPNGGLSVMSVTSATVHLDSIIAMAEQYKLPAIYPYSYFARSGGLVSYGFDNLDLWTRAATYVDRILKGERPADLPVQHPTKFELVINLKTAKALGLDVSQTLLARADEVIE